MSRKDMQSDEIEEIMKEMLNDDEYADEGFEDIDREDNRHESKKAMKKERKAERKSRRKKRKMSNKVAIALSLIVAVIAIGYVATAVFYSTHFFANTEINGVDCSNKSIKQVEAYLEKQVSDYNLTLKETEGKTEEISGQDISLKYVEGKQVEKLVKSQNPFLWPEAFWKSRKMEAKIGVEYDESALKALIANLDCMKEENQTEPVNAHPEFQNDKFVVIPETDGTKIDTDTFREKVITAVDGLNAEMDLSKEGCYLKPVIYC